MWANSSAFCSSRSASFQISVPRSDGVMRRPGAAVECHAGGLDGAIDVGFVAFGGVREDLPRGRVVGWEGEAGCGRHPLAVDQEFVGSANKSHGGCVELQFG